MNNGNGGPAAPLSVLAEINARLAAITPEQIIAPDTVREETTPVVAMATDEIKRLYTLRALLTNEYNEVVMDGREKAAQFVQDALRFFAEGNPDGDAQTLDNLLAEQLSVMEKMIAGQKRNDIVFKTVERLLWTEIRCQDPALTDAPIVAIHNDWSICRRDDDGDDGAEGTLRILRLSGSGSTDDLLRVLQSAGIGRH